jgi:peptidoglycan hydrolase CwlO-like protein
MSVVHGKFGEFPVTFDELVTEKHLFMRKATFEALVGTVFVAQDSAELTAMTAERDELLAKAATDAEILRERDASVNELVLKAGAAEQQFDKLNQVVGELQTKLTDALGANERLQHDLEWVEGENKALEEKLAAGSRSLPEHPAIENQPPVAEPPVEEHHEG